MSHFDYRNGELHAEAVPLARVAERYGTPCYVYSAETLRMMSTPPVFSSATSVATSGKFLPQSGPRLS